MTEDIDSDPATADSYESLSAEERALSDRIEALLGGEPAPQEPAPHEPAPHEVGEGDDLADFLEHVRSALIAETPGFGTRTSETLRAERVAQRVLARTTREDLSRRADVGVLLRFTAERLRESPLLRIAAALLIVQLTLVPLVAWQMLKAPTAGFFHTGFEPSLEELRDALRDLPSDELAELPLEALGEEGFGSAEEAEAQRALDLACLALDEDAAEARGLLRKVSLAADAGDATTSLGRALGAMTTLAASEDEVGSGERRLAEPTGPLEALILGEARLYLLEAGGSWEGLFAALEEAGRHQGDEALRSLSMRTLLRARLLGVELPIVPEDLAVGWQRGSGAWLGRIADLVEAASGDALEADPYVRAWIQAARDVR